MSVGRGGAWLWRGKAAEGARQQRPPVDASSDWADIESFPRAKAADALMDNAQWIPKELVFNTSN